MIKPTPMPKKPAPTSKKPTPMPKKPVTPIMLPKTGMSKGMAYGGMTDKTMTKPMGMAKGGMAKKGKK